MLDYKCKLEHEYCILIDIISNETMSEYIESDNVKNKHNIGKGTLEDVCECAEEDCLLRVIASNKFTRRQLEQIRCIADYKYIVCQNENISMNMDDAAMRWVKNGYAKAFSDVYNDKRDSNKRITHWELFVDVEKDINRKV